MEFDKMLSVLAWPTVALIFGLVMLWILRIPIIAFASKVNSIKAGGFHAEGPPNTQGGNLNVENKEAVHQLLFQANDTPALSEMVNQIRQELLTSGLSVDGDVPKILIRKLAATALLLKFEQIHSFIYGSQIHLLKKLNEVRAQGLPSAFVDTHFDHIKEMFPFLKELPIEKYMEFLETWALVSLSNGQLFITPLGIEYLTWIAKAGRSEVKGG